MFAGGDPADDPRREIPVLGFRDYWYPVIQEKKVPRRKPVMVKLLGEELCVFRGETGIAAVKDACPHRGTRLSAGVCNFAGTVSCPYHGWTFDESGACVAVLSEGPDSAIPGKVNLSHYTTETIKGMVFAWMGEGEPVPPEEDLAPELFDSSVIFFDETTWRTNWRPALENFQDNHAPYIHRNSIRLLLRPFFKVSYSGSRPVITGGGVRLDSYQDGTVADRPYRDYFEGVDGYWPKHTFRRVWAPLFRYWPLKWFAPQGGIANDRSSDYHDDLEWNNGPHMPGIQRILEQDWYGPFIYTRWCVPIDENTTREVYFHACRPPSRFAYYFERLRFPVVSRLLYYRNFGYQDGRVLEQTPYDRPERFSAFDAETIGWRRLAILSARHGGRHDKIPEDVIEKLNAPALSDEERKARA